MKLEVLPGRKGDCLLLHLTEDGQNRLVLIDGGPRGVWEDDLAPRLEELVDERGPGEKLTLDLVIVTHIDDDHINGILRLFNAIQLEDFPVEIAELWHNSFDRVLGNDETLKATKASVLNSIEQFGAQFTEDASHERGNAALVLSSVAQGDRLLSQANALEIPVNPGFDNNLVMAHLPPKARSIFGAQWTLEGPMRSELQALQEVFDEWLSKQDDERTTASLLASLADRSPANLSSIVLTVEADGRRFLLTGDARSDHILRALGEGSHHYDIIKLPHHGSDNNVHPEFFRTVIGDTYVFCGNGSHGNPERKTLEMLLDNREAEGKPRLVFTETIEDIDAKRKSEWKKQQRRNKKKGRKVTPWDPATMSLQMLFEERDDEIDLIVPDEHGLLDML